MKKAIIIYAMLSIFSSCYYNAGERNKIIVKDNFDSVQNALFQMEALIKKLPLNDVNVNYSVRDNEINVNKAPGRGDSVQYYTNKSLQRFTSDERKQFIKLAKYLQQNFITGGYLHYNSQVCTFEYRHKDSDGFNEVRDIAFLKDQDSLALKNEYKILDKKGQLLLLAPKEAKIYNNYTLVDDGK